MAVKGQVLSRKLKLEREWIHGLCCGRWGGQEVLSKEVTFQWQPQQSQEGTCDNTQGKCSPDREAARAKFTNRRMLANYNTSERPEIPGTVNENGTTEGQWDGNGNSMKEGMNEAQENRI